MQCPYCGAAMQQGVKFCQACGKPVATGAIAQAGGAAAAPAMVPGPYRSGKLLMVPIANPTLPMACVKCGQRATSTVMRKFSWSPMGIMLLFGALIASFFAKRMTFAVPLCDEHKSGRKKKMWIGAGLTFLSIPVLMVLGAVISDDMMAIGMLLGFVGFLVGVILWAGTYGILSPKKIDKEHGEFAGASEEFLRQLPAPTGPISPQ